MWLAFIVHPAFAQIQMGSVGVAHLTDEKIAMAADSRVTFGKDPARDDACKVTALGGKMLLVATCCRLHQPVSVDSLMEHRGGSEAGVSRRSSAECGHGGCTGDVAVALAKIMARRFSALFM
jgi:hypothetical protein